MPALGPIVHATAAGDCVIVLDLQLRRDHVRLGSGCFAQHGMRQIEDEVAAIALREGVLVQAGTLGGGQLSFDLVVVENDGIVAGLRALIIMGETRAIARAWLIGRTRFRVDRTGAGHQHHIEHVAHAGAAQVVVAKAHDGRVRVVIAGAPIPAAGLGIRTELHHSEGNGGARIGVAVAACSDKHVHRLG